MGNHMEGERIYVANARSKSGFLIATCDKAKTGCLDARGLGAIDPWRTALVAMATPKMKLIDLKSERDWLEQHDEGALIKIKVNLGKEVENDLGVPDVTVELPLTETAAALKAKLTAMGVKAMPANKMLLHNESVGFLKESRTFAYYNLEDGATCALSARKRAGSRFKADHTVMPKRPKAQSAPPPETAPDAKKPEDLPSLPGLPKLPGLPLPGAAGTAPGLGALAGLPGLPSLANLPGLPKVGGTAPGAGGALPSLPGLPGMPGLPGLPKLGALPGLGGIPPSGSMPAVGDPKAIAALMGADLGKVGAPLGLPPLDLAKGLPGLPPPGSDPKAAAMLALGKLGGLPGLPPMSGPSLAPPAGIPGLPPPGSDPTALLGKFGGMPGAPPSKAQMPSGPPGLGGV